MNEPAPIPGKKKEIWIWIIIAVVVLGLCCLVVVLAAGAYASWKGYINLPRVFNPTRPAQTAIPTSTERSVHPSVPTAQGLPPLAPNEAPTQILVEPYQPQPADDYPTLQDFVPNWEGSSTPGTKIWNLNMPASQSTLLFQGWCTTTPTILNQNFDHIQYLFEVDGQTLTMERLNSLNSFAEGQVCRDHIGLIRAWSPGSHIIKTIMRLDAQINDGWSDYPVGDYVEIYNITVTP